MADELPGLQFIYLDVWYQDGWESRRVAREINRQGWALTTEFPAAKGFTDLSARERAT